MPEGYDGTKTRKQQGSPGLQAVGGVHADQKLRRIISAISTISGRDSAIGCYLYILFIYATRGVAKWEKEVQSLDS